VTVERAALSTARRRGPTKGDLKEQAILETCERLLGERPLRDITVDELAAGAGISRPTFYFYFESKDAVLRALVGRIADALYDRSEGWLERGDDPPAEIARRSIETSARLWREHGPVLRAAVEAWGDDAGMRDFWEGTIGRFVRQSARAIDEERRAGEAPNGPHAEALAKALIWMNERCFYTSSLGVGPALCDDELVGTLTAIWLRAIYGDVTPRRAG
jgi:TetR/AcrR family transcriptional regulator, ethionamide resistance regulator